MMNRENLHLLHRLRQQAVDAAGQEYAASLRAEDAATQAVRAQAATIDQHRQIAEQMESADCDVEAYGIWLRHARAELDSRIVRQERAMVETARSRAILSAARTALETMTTLLDEARLADQAAAARREQQQSDEAAGARHTRERGNS